MDKRLPTWDELMDMLDNATPVLSHKEMMLSLACELSVMEAQSIANTPNPSP